MRYPILFLLMACLTAADLPPKPKAPALTAVVVTCPATGDCQLIAAWTRPPAWRAGDSLKVVWSQSAPSAKTFPAHYPKGTADTLMLPRTVEGQAFAGKVVATTLRPGTTVTASANAPWTAPAVPVAPPSPVDSLRVSELRVVPPSLTLLANAATTLCTMVRWSDGSRTRVLPWPADCEAAYQAWLASA